MKRFLRKDGQEKGFTLIELLIVLGIIAALVAAIAPNLSVFQSRGETGGKETENDAVQSALDLMMTDKGKSAVTANSSTATNDFSSVPVEAGAGGLGTYLRSTTTVYAYCWDTTGKVTNQLDLTPTPLTC